VGATLAGKVAIVTGAGAAGPTLAIKFTKMAVNKAIRERANLVFETSLLLEGLTRLSENHQEATASFVEKRKPEFRGR
jgi:enoyl-CoA hydratase/carnithine racemase